MTTPQDDHADDENELHFRDFGIGMFVLALTFGIIARSASAGARLVDKSTWFGRYERNVLNLITRFPYTVLVMVIGLLVGAILTQQEDAYGDGLGESIRHWSSVSPEVILFAILPILLFESAFSSDVHIMRHEAPQILALAGPGVILQTALMAIFSKFTFNYGDNWNWYTALMFGSMMSATDPVAVVALVKELGMNARIGTLIEGEGLMNDGTAIVLFNVFRAAITSQKGLTPGGVIGTAFRLSLGGPVVGVVIGAATSACLAYFTYNDLQSEVTLTIVGCYGCFLVAEGTPLHVSGVLAVVFCGLYLSFYGRGNISVKVEHSLHAFWHMAEYIADTLIFFVAGVVMASKMLADDIDGHDWANLFSFFLACQAIRAINIFACWPVLKQGYGVSWQEGVFLVFGGLRGAIGLALALVVETEIKDEYLETRLKNKIVFLMSGVAFLSLIVNGTLILPLVKYLKLDRVSVAESEMFDHACLVIERHLEHFVESDLKSDKFLGDADYALVWRYVPVSSAQQYWQRVRLKKIILSKKEKSTMRAIVMSNQQADPSALGPIRAVEGGRVRSDQRRERQKNSSAAASSPTFGEPHPIGPPPAAMATQKDSGDSDTPPTSPWNGVSTGELPKLPSPETVATRATFKLPSQHSNSCEHGATPLPEPPKHTEVTFASSFKRPVESPESPKQEHISRFRRGSSSALSRGASFFSFGFGGSIDQSEHNEEEGGSIDFTFRPRGISAWLSEDSQRPGGIRVWGLLKELPSIFFHGAKAGVDAWNEVNTAYLSIPPRLRPYWHSLHREYFSLGDSANRESVLRRRQDKDSHFYRTAVAGASKPQGPLVRRASRDPGALDSSVESGRMGLGMGPRRRLSPPGLAPGLGGHRPSFYRSASSAGLGAFPEVHKKNKIGGGYRRPGLGKQMSLDSFGGIPPMSSNGLVRERENLLNQMSQLKEALHANDQARAQMHSRLAVSRNTSNVYNEESMEKARTRFMNAVRSQYQANHHLGRMKASVLRTLRESADRQLDCPSEPLHDFDYLESKLTMSPRLQLLARNFAGVPLVAGLLNQFIYIHLAFMIELASEFVRAHQAVEIHDLLDEGEVARELIKENKTQLDKVNALLKAQLPVFPEITHALKTQTAARQLLMYHMRLTEHLMKEGTITEKEFESLTHKTDEMLIKLHGHPLTEKLPQKVDMLLSADFLKGVALDDIERLALLTSYATEIFVEPGVQLFTAGETCVTGGPCQSKHGWFLLVRGVVTCSVANVRGFGSSNRVLSFGTKSAEPFHGSENSDLPFGNDDDSFDLADIAVQPGSTIGLVEQLLGVPFEQDFTTSTYCHLLYIDAPCALREGAKNSHCGKAIFEAMFKVAAVTLLPPLMGLDNDLVDPLGLVSSRDRFGGWDAAAFALLTSSTNEADRRSRRLAEIQKAYLPGGSNDGHGFLGIAAFKSTVFLRPVEEDVLSSPLSDHSASSVTAAKAPEDFSAHDSGGNLLLGSRPATDRQPSTYETVSQSIMSQAASSAPSAAAAAAAAAGRTPGGKGRGFLRLQSSAEMPPAKPTSGGGGNGGMKDRSRHLSAGSFRSGIATSRTKSSTDSEPALEETAKALAADHTKGQDEGSDVIDLPRLKQGPPRTRNSSMSGSGGGCGRVRSQSSQGFGGGNKPRYALSFHDLAEPASVTLLGEKRRGNSVQWHPSAAKSSAPGAPDLALPCPRRSARARSTSCSGYRAAAAATAPPLPMSPPPPLPPTREEAPKTPPPPSLTSPFDDDDDAGEPMPPAVHALFNKQSPGDGQNVGGVDDKAARADTRELLAQSEAALPPPPPLPLPAHPNTPPFSPSPGVGPVRQSSSGVSPRWGSSSGNTNSSSFSSPTMRGRSLSMTASGAAAATARARRRALTFDANYHMAEAGGTATGASASPGLEAGSRSSLLSAETPSQANNKPTQQWVIQLSGTKTYLLLRGRILGRAEESSSTREVSSMIESVSTLAQTATELEHISEEELDQLHSLLRKLHETPVTPSKKTAPNTSYSGVGGQSTGAAGMSFSCTGGAGGGCGGAVVGVGSANGGVGNRQLYTLPPVAAAHARRSASLGGGRRSTGDDGAAVNRSKDEAAEDEDEGGGPTRFLHRYKSNGAGGSGGNLPEDGWFVREHMAPCLVSSVKGRVAVSARTVVMEIPNDICFGAKAALCFLTRLRETQVGIGADDDEDEDDNEDGRASSGRSVAANSSIDFQQVAVAKLRQLRKAFTPRRGGTGANPASSEDDEDDSHNGRSAIPAAYEGSLDSSIEIPSVK